MRTDTPVYAVCPLLVTVTVWPTSPPGTALGGLAAGVTVSAGTSTWTAVAQPGPPPTGQVVPAAAEETVLISVRSPRSGSCTVTEKVTVAVAPTARSPVQVSSGVV